jgi:hypothetical protein
MFQKLTLFCLLFLLTTTASYAQFPCISGTTVSAAGQGDIIDLCQFTGSPVFSFNNSIEAIPHGFIVTDENDMILQVGLQSPIDFSNLPVANYRVYGFNFTGNLDTDVDGQSITTAQLADGCYAITSNFISLTTDGFEGGTVATEDGETTVYTCPGDGNPDIISFDSTGVTDYASYAYVVTDENGIILDFPTGDNFDFDAAPAGTCLVWGLAYTGNVTAQIGDDAAAVALSDGCFSLSDNFITVVRETPEGGTVATEDGETLVYTCPGDGNPDIISFDSTGTSSGPMLMSLPMKMASSSTSPPAIASTSMQRLLAPASSGD